MPIILQVRFTNGSDKIEPNVQSIEIETDLGEQMHFVRYNGEGVTQPLSDIEEVRVLVRKKK